MSWDILEFVLTWIWVICGVILVLIMARTVLDLSKKVVDEATPGVRRLWSRRRG